MKYKQIQKMYDKLGKSAKKDATFLLNRPFTVRKIRLIYGVPPELLNHTHLTQLFGIERQGLAYFQRWEKQMALVNFKMPKTLGACADALYTLRKERLALEDQAEKIKQKESAIKEYFIKQVPKSKADGIIGKLATAKLNPTMVAQVEDWDKLHAYIVKKKAWELLQRRVSDSAARERWEAGESIPGVKPFKVINVSTTKR